jgi:hypothetical protein
MCLRNVGIDLSPTLQWIQVPHDKVHCHTCESSDTYHKSKAFVDHLCTKLFDFEYLIKNQKIIISVVGFTRIEFVLSDYRLDDRSSIPGRDKGCFL